MQQEWHTAEWGTWGWAETILKLIAIGAGIFAGVGVLSGGEFMLGGNPRLAAVILLALLTLGAVLQVVIRYGQREIISLIFAVLNLLGHSGLLIALLRAPDQRTLPILFGVFYVLGQVVKLQFLRVSGYTEGGASTRGMLRVTGVMATLYTLFTILILG
jgi:hypothetical protein